MLENLDAVPWHDLEHAYGFATDIPGLLLDLAEGDETLCAQAIEQLWSNIYHQGSRYSASVAAMPFLAVIADTAGHPARVSVVELLVHLLLGFPESFSLTGYVPGKDDRELAAAYEQTVPVFRRMLRETSSQVREVGAYALAWHQIDRDLSIEALVKQLTVEDEPSVRFSIFFALGHLDDGSRVVGTCVQALESQDRVDQLGASLALVMTSPDTVPNVGVTTLFAASQSDRQVLERIGDVPHHEGDIANLSLLALDRLGDGVREQALDGILETLREASATEGLRTAPALLTMAFGEDTSEDGSLRSFATLTKRQRAVLELLARVDGVWVFANVMDSFRAYGLPSSREGLIRYLDLDFVPDSDAVAKVEAPIRARVGMPETSETSVVPSTSATSPDPSTPWPEVTNPFDSRRYPCLQPDRTISTAVAVDERSLVVAGPFMQFSKPLAAVVGMDASGAEVEGVFPELAKTPRLLVPDHEGGFYVDARPLAFPPSEWPGIAHILPDGHVDFNFRPPFRTSIHTGIFAMGFGDDRLFARGRFEHVGGTSLFTGLIMLDPSTGEVYPTSLARQGGVNFIIRDGERIWMGESGNPLEGRPTHGLAVLNVDTLASLDRGFDPPGEQVRSMHIAKSAFFLDVVTMRDRIYSTLTAVERKTGRLLWQRDDLKVMSQRPLGVSQGKLWVGISNGSFPTDLSERLLCLDAETGATLGGYDARGGDAPEIRSGLLQGDRLTVVGRFSEFDGQPRENIAQVRVTDGALTPFRGFAEASPMGALAPKSDAILVAGSQKRIEHIPTCGLARIDLNNGQVIDVGTEIAGEVTHLSGLPSGRLVVAVRRDETWPPKQYLATIDVESGESRRWSDDFNAVISGLVVDENRSRLWVAGEFTRIGEAERWYLACYSIETGALEPFQIKPDRTVNAIALEDDRIWLGGTFGRLGRERHWCLAALSASTGEVVEHTPAPDGPVDAIVVAEGRLFMAGSFHKVGGKRREGLASFDTTTMHVSDWAPRPTGQVEALCASGEGLWVSGNFDRIGDRPRNGLAVFSLPEGELYDVVSQNTVPRSHLCSFGDQVVVVPPLGPNTTGEASQVHVIRKTM